MRSGIQRINDERIGQFNREGWSVDHDIEEHPNGELLDAALCYIANAHGGFDVDEETWPWDPSWDKRHKHSELRSLAIAGALIAAEIDRRLADDQDKDAGHDYILDGINTVELAGMRGFSTRRRYSAVLRDVPTDQHPTSDLRDITLPLTETQAAKLAKHMGEQITISITTQEKK